MIVAFRVCFILLLPLSLCKSFELGDTWKEMRIHDHHERAPNSSVSLAIADAHET